MNDKYSEKVAEFRFDLLYLLLGILGRLCLGKGLDRQSLIPEGPGMLTQVASLPPESSK